jgi:hypothetical protein
MTQHITSLIRGGNYSIEHKQKRDPELCAAERPDRIGTALLKKK